MVASFLGAALCFGVVLVVATLCVPRTVDVRLSAQRFPDGQREISLRAIEPNDVGKELYRTNLMVPVSGGQMEFAWTLPRNLYDKQFIIEVCSTPDGTSTEVCAYSGGSSKEVSVKGVQSNGPLYSCPYYVSQTKTTLLANLFGNNAVALDNRVYCSVPGNRDEFGAESRVDQLANVQNNTSGISVTGSGVVIAKDGALSVVDPATLFSQTQVVNQYYPTTVIGGGAPQTLTLSGRTLSISGGNAVVLPDTQQPTANSTTSGLLSAADWNTFAGKENSLSVSSGLLRTGNTIGLMSCAAGEILKNNGATWVCAQDIVGTPGTTYSAGTGLSLTGTTFSNTGLLSASASGALTATTTAQNAAISLATTSDLTQLGNQLGLADTGVTPGTYNNVTVDGKGRVTSATNVSYLTTEQDGVVGNEVAGVVTNGGLIMTGAGTSASPYKVGLVTTCADGQLLKYTAAGGWACANDTDTNTDQQLLSYNTSTNVLSLTNGGTVDLSSLKDNTDSQAISKTGNTLSISGNASTVDLTPYLDNTDSQTLTITDTAAGTHSVAISGGNSQTLTESQALGQTTTPGSGTAGSVVNSYQVTLTNGGSVTMQDTNTTYSNGNGLSLTGTVFAINAPTCPAGQYLTWTGTSFSCGTPTDTNTTYSAGSGIALTGTTFSLAQQGATTGQVMAWNGSGWAPMTPSTFSDTDQQNLSYNASTGVLSIDRGTGITFPLSGSTQTNPSLLTAADWAAFNGKENVLAFSDGLARSSNTVTLMDCAANQILQRNSGDTAWVCANQVTDTNTTYTAGTGLSLTGTTFENTGTLSVTASGALSSSGGQNPAITLATGSDLTQLGSQLGLTDTGVAAGTYNNVTVDTKGRVTSATNVSYLTTEQDGVVGNEVADVVNGGGLVMTGAGTAGSPYKVGLITTCADGQLLKYTAAGGWACADDTDTNTDQQLLSYSTSTNVLSLTNGGTVDLSSLKDNTDSQSISKTGNTLSISGNASTVDLTPYLDNTDSQTLTITDGAAGSHTVAISGGNSQTLTESQALSYNSSTRVISLTNGGSVTLPADNDTTYSNGNGLSLTGTVFAINAPTCSNAGDKLLWSGTAFTCGVDVDTNTTYTAGSGLSLTGTTFALAQQGATSGQVLKWNGTDWAPAADVDTNTTYTAGSGITISGASNQIAINASTCPAGQYLTWNGSDFSCGTPTDTNSGGTITNVSGSGPISVANGTTTPTVSLNTSGVTAGAYGSSTSVPVLTVDTYGRVTAATTAAIPTANTTTTGLLSSTGWNAFNGKENVITFNGNGLFTRTGNTVTGATCATTGYVLKWNGTSFACAADTDTPETAITVTDSSTIDLTASGTANHTITAIIIDGSVTTAKLADNSVSVIKIIDGAVTSAKLADGSVVTAKLADGSVTTAKLADDAVTSAKIVDGTVVTADLANSAVTTTKIADSNVTTAKLADGSITTAKVAACSSDGQILKYYTVDPDGVGPLTAGWNCAADANSDAVSSVFGRTGAVTAQNGDYSASQITNVAAGNIASTTVQAALNELDAEKLSTTLNNGQIWVGNGSNVATAVTPSGDVTISNTGVTTIQANSVALGTDTTGNYVAGATAGSGITVSGTAGEGWSPTIAINAPTCTAGQYLTWSGAAFSCAVPTDTNSGGTVTSITAGTGLSGGTITGSGTIGLNNTTVTAGTFAPANNANGSIAIPQFTVDAQGRLTAASTTNVTPTGIANSQLANSSITVNTAGALSGGATVSLGGTVNLALNLSAAGATTTATTNSGSGLEVASGSLGLIRGCANGQLLKWDATNKQWACANDTDTNSGGTVTSVTSGNAPIVIGGTAAAPTVSLGTAGTAGTYGSGTSIPVITTDAYGRVTAVTNTPVPTASTTTTGLLTTAGWNTFNNKQNALTVTGNGLFTYTGGNTLTGATCTTTGQILKWTGTTFACAADNDTTYTAGTGITITSGAIAATLGTDITSSEIVDGTIAAADLANSGATAGMYGDTSVNVAQLTVNAQGQVTAISNRALPTANTTTAGILSSADWNTFNGKENVLTFNGPLTRTSNTISMTACASGQYYQYNGTAWVCTTSTGGGFTPGSVAFAGSTGNLTQDNPNFFFNDATNILSVGTTNGYGAITAKGGTSFATMPYGTATIGQITHTSSWDGSGFAFANSSAGSNVFSMVYNADDSWFGQLTPAGTKTIMGQWNASRMYLSGNLGVGNPNPTVKFDVTSGIPYFQVDATNNQIRVGSTTGDATAISLVLDSYNVATDPTGSNGSMYYNSALGKFRCYENGTWKDCITAGPERVILATKQTNTTTTQADVTGLTLPVTAGRTYIFSCRMTHTTAVTTTAALFSVNGPASTNISYTVKTGYTATAEYQNSATAFNTAVNPGTGPGTTARQVFIDGTFTATVSGTFAVRYASEVAGSAVNVLPNSYCTLE